MKTIHVVAAVIENEGKILATQRGYGEFEGMWEFPGGKVEPGESAGQALVREINEELGVGIEVGEYICTAEYDYPNFHLKMECWMCRILGGQIELREHKSARWLSAQNLNEVEWLPADIEVIEHLQKFKFQLRLARQIKTDPNFYAESYHCNIYKGEMEKRFRDMFGKGGGKELLPKDGKKEKGACIYSSSMLAYNFFSWISKEQPLVLDGVKYVKVLFEQNLRVLKNRNNKANMDVVLVSDDAQTILLLECKFTEHFKYNKVSISDAYFCTHSYYTISNPSDESHTYGSKWVQTMNELKADMNSGKEAYYGGIKQAICHLIGISNATTETSKNGDAFCLNNKNLIFKSVVFIPITEPEKTIAENYIKYNKEFVSRINFLPKNINISEPINTYRQIWNAGIQDSIQDPELKKYLERYLLVHA